MAKVRFTSRARADLLDIWGYVAERGGLRVADAVYDRIAERCGMLRSHPQLGRARPEIAGEARSISVERWIVFYRTMGIDVQVVRIIDGARDLAQFEWTAE
ncbi:MAG: type II toxin-antitoxin system RelE/ParE family toxin [Rhizobiaceae bacterium]|nr:type II toxin-antitoxin system RelE/ParE family toxin [Rhizobiaceae bacterium]